MNEEEFQETSNRLMGILNTRGVDAARAELDSINQRLRAKNQRIDYSGAKYLGVFSLHDIRTNERLFECRLGSIKNWPKTS
jgi:hypothetical protein